MQGIDLMHCAKIGEHLVCADLWAMGHRAFIVSEGVAYDILVEIGDRVFRLQVKTTIRPRNINSQGKNPNYVYAFDTRRRGVSRKRSLTADDCELIACVALDTKQIAYIAAKTAADVTAIYPTGHVFIGSYRRTRRVTIGALTLENALTCV